MAYGDRGGVVGNRVPRRKKKKENRVPRGIDRVEEIRSSRREPARDVVEEHRQSVPLRARPKKGRASSRMQDITFPKRPKGEDGSFTAGLKRAAEPFDPRDAPKRTSKLLTLGLGEDMARTFARHTGVPFPMPWLNPDDKPIEAGDALLEAAFFLPPIRGAGAAAKGGKALATGADLFEAGRAAKAGYHAPIRGAFAARRLRKFEKTLSAEARQRRSEIHGLIDETLPDHNERVATKELYDVAAESMGRRTGGSADDFYTKFAGATTEPPPRVTPHDVPEDIAVLYQSGPPEAPALPDRIEGDALTQHVYSLAKAGAAYRDWYDRAAGVIRQIAEHEGVTFDQMAQVVAITSQGANPTFNLRLAVAAVRQFKEAGKVERGYIFDPKKVESVLQGGDWAGKKTNSFYRNITSQTDDVTVDRHIARTTHGVENPSEKQYEQSAAVFRQIAKQLGWQPKEVQAAAWIPIKAQGLAETTFSRMQKKGWTEARPRENYFATAGDAYEKGFGRYQNETLLQATWADNPPAALERKGVESPVGRPAVYEGVMDTLHGSGGHTWNSDLSSYAGEGGYAVGISEKRGVEIPVGEFKTKDVEDFRAANADLFEKNPDLKVGSWVDDGKVYLDISAIVPRLDDAVRVGREQNQLAIYDIANGKDVPLNAEVLHQAEPAAKGAVSFQDDGRVILHAFAGSADVSTFVHEVGHVLRRYALNDEEERLVAKWAGAKELDGGGFDWHVEAEEKFARGFEQYLRTSRPPTKGLKKAFRTLRDALVRIYEQADLPEVSDDVRTVFDDLLGGNRRPRGAGDKVAQSLGKAKKLRAQQERGYSEERARRVARGEEAMSIGGREGLDAALGELKGELPKLKFGALEGEFDQQTVDDLLTFIQSREDLRFFERIRTQRALIGALEGKVPTRSEIKLLEKTFGPELATQIADSVPFWAKAKNVGLEAINIPRAIMASVDLSAPFRQGLVLGARHPKTFAREWGPMVKAFGSEGAYDNVMEDIASRPTFESMQKAGLAITDLEHLEKREEQFISNYAEFLTGGKRSPVRMSGRAYVAFLNKFRADAFDNYLHMAEAAGRDITDEKLLKDIAKWVNTATGRGSWKRLESSMTTLNAALFSPRLIVSRVQLLNPFFYARLDPFVRRQALQGMGQLVGAVALTLYMAHLAGASVGLDPRSSDFGKVRVGDTRIDIAGGLQQYLVLYSRLVKGELVSSSSGQVQELSGGFMGKSRATILGRFAEQKLSPVGAYLWGYMKNENFEGDEFDPAKEAGKSLIPLGIQNTYDAYKEGPGVAAASGALGSVGFGAQTYPNTKSRPRREPTTPNEDAEAWIAEKEQVFGTELPPDVKRAVRDKAQYQNLQELLKDQLDLRSLTDKQRTALKIAVLTHDQTPPWLSQLKNDLKTGDEATQRAIDNWVEKELGWNELEQISEAAGRVKVGTP